MRNIVRQNAMLFVFLLVGLLLLVSNPNFGFRDTINPINGITKWDSHETFNYSGRFYAVTTVIFWALLVGLLINVCRQRRIQQRNAIALVGLPFMFLLTYMNPNFALGDLINPAYIVRLFHSNAGYNNSGVLYALTIVAGWAFLIGLSYNILRGEWAVPPRPAAPARRP